ncbi:hypothetical protein ACS0TY_011266 [Phlomoides rotata]
MFEPGYVYDRGKELWIVEPSIRHVRRSHQVDSRARDLSFNNFSGQIPDSLFNMSSLVHLFLGNNKLTGFLPAEKTSTLQFIDVSYNELSGSFHSWADQRDLQLNLVANNFRIADTHSRVLASGLNCLQRNFPCSRGDPRCK